MMQRDAAPKQAVVVPPTATSAPLVATSDAPTYATAHAFSRVAVGVQRKLTVNQPGDRYEQEAERIAAAVVNDAGNATAAPPPRTAVQRAAAGSQPTGGVPAIVHAALATSGQPLDAETSSFMAQRLGHDFGHVRIHTDSAAADAAEAINARAYTHGRDIVFGAGQYAPHTAAGRRLIAHELTHVVQQGSAAGLVQRSYGTTGGNARARKSAPVQTIAVPSEEELPDVQRDTVDGGGGAPAAPSLATPTIALTPGNTLTRGTTLTATKSFQPNAGETLTVTGWRYITDSDTVDRATTDATFQTQWDGTMALSGTLELSYQITPAGGTAEPVATVQQAITVEDRTGAPWESTVTDQPERSYARQPSPPQLFRHLGLHQANANPLPTATGTAIASGPNAGFTYVSALTAGTFTSRPNVHPDLLNNRSRFFRFHQDASRLYLVVGANRTLIPLGEYSGLSVAGGTLTFTVPDWEAFYKRHSFYAVTASANGTTVPLRNAWWGLSPNAEDGTLVVRDAAAIRAALQIGADEAFSISAQSPGSWEGFQLMPAAAILDGTRSHEYQHGTHSHRANFHKMMRALDPQRKIESKVGTPSQAVAFATEISDWWNEIVRPDHELVDEAASRTQESFVAAAGSMAGVNTDPGSGAFLGSVWNISGDQEMT